MGSLVQRARFEINTVVEGIDDLLNFDYMGSAEFEFGALGKSLKKMRANSDSYTLFDFSINNKVISVLCKSEQIEFVKHKLVQFSENKTRTKEYTDFDNYVYTTDSKWRVNRTDFWWDILDHFMFWKKEDKFAQLFMSTLFPKQISTAELYDYVDEN